MFDIWVAVPCSVGFLIALLRCFVVFSSIEHVASVCPACRRLVSSCFVYSTASHF